MRCDEEKMRVLISTGGSAELTPAFMEALRSWKPELVIAADSGLRHLVAAGIRPDILLGDMDSVNPALLASAKKQGITPLLYPVQKDEPDTELAVDEALRLAGADAEIRLIGGFGTRPDHSFGNLNLLHRHASQAEFWDGKYLAKAVNVKGGDTRCSFELRRPDWFDTSAAAYVSLLPFGTPVKGITLEGLAYPTYRADWDRDAVIGLSNQFMSDDRPARVTYDSGSLLVIISQD